MALSDQCQPGSDCYRFLWALGMKSKPGEDFLSLQCKDSTSYPLPPLYLSRWIFTCGHLWWSDPLPTPYLYIVKIEKFHPVLTRSLTQAYTSKRSILIQALPAPNAYTRSANACIHFAKSFCELMNTHGIVGTWSLSNFRLPTSAPPHGRNN